MNTIDLYVGLTMEQALALAQFLKRVGIDDYRSLAVDQDEAWLCWMPVSGCAMPCAKSALRRVRQTLGRRFRPFLAGLHALQGKHPPCSA